MPAVWEIFVSGLAAASSNKEAWFDGRADTPLYSGIPCELSWPQHKDALKHMQDHAAQFVTIAFIDVKVPRIPFKH